MKQVVSYWSSIGKKIIHLTWVLEIILHQALRDLCQGSTRETKPVRGKNIKRFAARDWMLQTCSLAGQIQYPKSRPLRRAVGTLVCKLKLLSAGEMSLLPREAPALLLRPLHELIEAHTGYLAQPLLKVNWWRTSVASTKCLHRYT